MYATQFYDLNVVLTKTVKEDVAKLGYTGYFQCTCHIDHYLALNCFHNRKYFVSNITYNWQTTTVIFKIGKSLSMEWIYLVKILGTLLLG